MPGRAQFRFVAAALTALCLVTPARADAAGDAAVAAMDAAVNRAATLVFDYPTPAALAGYVDEQLSSAAPVVAAPNHESARLSRFDDVARELQALVSQPDWTSEDKTRLVARLEGILTELTATLILVPTGVQTLATQFWSYQQNLAYGQAAPFALLMIAIAAVPSYVLGRFFDRLPAQGLRT